MNELNHMAQASLLNFTDAEETGISKAVDLMRDMKVQPLTRDEQIGVHLAAERVQRERKRRNALLFPKDAEKGNGLVEFADEIGKAWKRELNDECGHVKP